MGKHHRSQRQRVHFVAKADTVLEVESYMEDAALVPKLWYNAQELKVLKSDIKESAREWRKTGLGILLHDTFDKQTDDHPELTQKCLNAFAQLSESEYNRGIERYLSRQHDEKRVQVKHNHVQDVLEQERYLQNHSRLSVEQRRMKLAEFAQLQSKAAEVFARRVGKADERAVMRGEDPSAAPKLISEICRYQDRKQQRRNSCSNAPISIEDIIPMDAPPSKGIKRFFKMQRRLSC